MAVGDASGRRTAIRRAFLAALGVAAVGGALVGWFAAPFGRPAGPDDLVVETSAAPVTPLAALAAGTCLAEFGSITDAVFDPAPCDQPHRAEVLGRVAVAEQFPDGSWPGDAELATRVSLACQSASMLDLDAAAAVPGLSITARWPSTQAEWDAGFRDYICVAVAPDATLTGSLRPAA